MANIAADAWQIALTIAPQMHPQIADEAARAMIALLKGPAAAPVYKAKGMEQR